MKINQVWVTIGHHIAGTTAGSTGRHLFNLREGHRALPALVKTWLGRGLRHIWNHQPETVSSGDQWSMVSMLSPKVISKIVCKNTKRLGERHGYRKYGNFFVLGRRMGWWSGLLLHQSLLSLCSKSASLGRFSSTLPSSWPTIHGLQNICSVIHLPSGKLT